MDNTAVHTAFHAILHQIQCIFCRISAVDHKWKLFFARNLHLCQKHFLLDFMFMFFFMPVIIQTNLSDCHSFRQAGQLTYFFQSFLRHFFRIIRMNTERAINKRILFH